MKIEKIFKMAEEFLGMNEKKLKKKSDKKKKLKVSLEKKITSIKDKIKKASTKKLHTHFY